MSEGFQDIKDASEAGWVFVRSVPLALFANICFNRRCFPADHGADEHRGKWAFGDIALWGGGQGRDNFPRV